MKKTIIKIASMLSALLLLMSTLFGVSAYAISTPCVEDHFSKLVFGVKKYVPHRVSTVVHT